MMAPANKNDVSAESDNSVETTSHVEARFALRISAWPGEVFECHYCNSRVLTRSSAEQLGETPKLRMLQDHELSACSHSV
jgi:hypothetical protein